MTNDKFDLPNSHALLIGVGADLPMTVQDATALDKLLVDTHRAAYPPEQVELLVDANASRQNILDALDRLIKRANATSNATVIVYFSGHGGQIEYLNAPSEYFLVTNGYDPSRQADTSISGREFTQKLEAIKARKLVVLLDCCHAGGVPALKGPGAVFVKSPMPPEVSSLLESGSGMVVVASSHENEYSYTGTLYSVFTNCLLEALEGNASASDDGFVRVLDVLIYLFKHVPERAPGPQHPLVKKVLDLGDNFPICYCAGGSKRARVSEHFSALADLTAGQRRRLEQKRDAIQQEWNLRNEKIKQLRSALAVEAGIAVKFQLQRQSLEEEYVLARLGEELGQIERTLQELGID